MNLIKNYISKSPDILIVLEVDVFPRKVAISPLIKALKSVSYFPANSPGFQ